MKIRFLNLKRNESGQVALLTTLFFLIISALIAFAFTNAALSQARSSRDLLNSKRAYAASESGIERLVYALASQQSYPAFTLSYGNNTISPTMSSVAIPGGNRYTISATGQGNVTRKVSVSTPGSAIELPYAVMAGVGGIEVRNTSDIYDEDPDGIRVYTEGVISTNNNSTDHIFAYTHSELTSGQFSGTTEAQLCASSDPSDDCVNPVTPVLAAGAPVDLPTNSRLVGPFIVDTTLPYAPGTINTCENSLSMPITETNPNTNGLGNPDGTLCALPYLHVKNQGQVLILSDIYFTGVGPDGYGIFFESPGATNKCKAFAIGEPRMLIAANTVNIQNTCNVTGDDVAGAVSYGAPSEDAVAYGARKLGFVSLETNGDAITIRNSSIATFLYAPYSTVKMRNQAEATAVYGEKVSLEDGSSVYYDYEDGVVDEFTNPDSFVRWQETY